MKPEGYVHGMTDKPAATVPIPPASPTVTLDRETFDKLRGAWATRSVNFEHNCVTLDFGAAEEIEALLRAAERQK